MTSILSNPYNSYPLDGCGNPAAILAGMVADKNIPAMTDSYVPVAVSPFGGVCLGNEKIGVNIDSTPFGLLGVVNPVKLVGASMPGSTNIDPNIWSVSTVNGASTIQANGQVLLNTGTNTGANVMMSSVVPARHMYATANKYLGAISVNNITAANNCRRWGAFDASNGIFFELRGADFGVVVRNNGEDTRVDYADLQNPYHFVLDTNHHTYEICYYTHGAWFIIDGRLLHKFGLPAFASMLCGNFHLKASVQNLSLDGGTADTSLELHTHGIQRFGSETVRPMWKRFKAATSTPLKFSPGTLRSVVINSFGTGTATLVLYDNVDAAGAAMAGINLGLSAVASPMFLPYDIDFYTGLTAVISGSSPGDVTIIYE